MERDGGRWCGDFEFRCCEALGCWSLIVDGRDRFGILDSLDEINVSIYLD